MADYSLTPQSALKGLDIEKPGLRLTEVTNLALVAMSVAKDGEAKLSEIIQSVFKIQLPDIGKSVTASADKISFYKLQVDQYFVQFEFADDSAVEVLSKHISDAAYLSDQSDSWVTINLSGDNSLAVLERICPLDMVPSVFPVGAVARTSMHHLAVIIIREGLDSFKLLSPRSSAESFMHALDVTLL